MIARTLSLAMVALAVSAVPVGAAMQSYGFSFQGRATDDAGADLTTGSIAVRIYTAPTGGTLVYDSGVAFSGAITDGSFDVTLGAGTALALDDTLRHYMEVDVDGDEIVGDAGPTGRLAFFPGGGSHARPDLEVRLGALEAALGASAAAGGSAWPGGAERSGPANAPDFAGAGATRRLSFASLGIGGAAGSGATRSVQSTMPLQPVGVYATPDHMLMLGPFHAPGAIPVSVKRLQDAPARVALGIDPNPARAAVNIRFDLPRGGGVALVVYDINGRRVATLARGAMEPGRYAMRWDPRDAGGRSLSPGAYFCRLEAGTDRLVRRVVIMR